MDKRVEFSDRVALRYPDLSGQLRSAADYVLANPLDVATRSLRAIAAASDLPPATFSRLARALDFDTYESLREECRGIVSRRSSSFTDKAAKLRTEREAGDQAGPLLARQSAASIENITNLYRTISPERMEALADRLHTSRRVFVAGSLSSTGIADYLAYLMHWMTDRWRTIGSSDSAFGAALSDMGEEDSLLIISMEPFAAVSMRAAELAAERGAHIAVVTDSLSCPALRHAAVPMIVATDSPQFFSSYASTLVLLETLVGMLVARAGPVAETRIGEVEDHNKRLGEYWAG